MSPKTNAEYAAEIRELAAEMLAVASQLEAADAAPGLLDIAP